jgi:hypothetical protein
MLTNDTSSLRWRVDWSAVWVGALAAIALGLLIGLIGFAVGAHEMSRTLDWGKMRLVTVIFSVAGAFFSFVVGAWVAARLAGVRRSEPAMLLGAVVWLLGTALLLVLAAVGATPHFGGWYGGLAGAPPWAAVPPVDPVAAAIARNTAVATVTALLLGLVGSILGGWMASGEPMTFTYYRRRTLPVDRIDRTHRAA